MHETARRWWQEAQTISDLQVTAAEMRALTPEGLAARLGAMGFTLVEQALPDFAGGEGTFLRETWRPEEYDRYLAALHRRGMCLVTYTNVHWLVGDLAAQHPEWLQVDERGEPPVLGYGQGHAPCPNGPWGAWAVERLREQARRYALDGIFLDGPTFYRGTCYCAACRERFQAEYGRALPPWNARSHAAWPAFAAFREASLARFVGALRQAVKAERADAIVFMNNASLLPSWTGGRVTRRLAPHLDLLGNERGNLFNNVPPPLAPLWLTGAGAAMLDRQAERPDGSRLPTVVYCCFRHLPWDYYGLTPVEMELFIGAALAAGANPQIMGGLRYVDPPLEAVITDLLHFARHHADSLADTRSTATTAVVWPQATADWGGTDPALRSTDGTFGWDRLCWDEFAGCYESLVRAQVPADVIDDEGLAELPEGRYDSLVLPAATCLSERAAGRLRRFVQDGGALLATGAPGVADEQGRRRERGLLDDVLGVRTSPAVVGPRPIDYVLPDREHQHWSHTRRPVLPSPVWTWIAEPTGAQPTARSAEKLPSRYFPLHVATDAPGVTFRHTFGQGHVTYVAGLAGALVWSQRFPEWQDFLVRAAAAVERASDHLAFSLEGAPRSVQFLARQTANGDLMFHLLNRTAEMERPIRKVLPVHGARLRVRLPTEGRRTATAHALRAQTDVPVEHDGRVLRLSLPDLGPYEVIRLSWQASGS